jgi:hypothetical protein
LSKDFSQKNRHFALPLALAPNSKGADRRELELHKAIREPAVLASARACRLPLSTSLRKTSLSEHLPKELTWISSQGLGHDDEFRDAYLSLMTFDHADHRVRSLQESRKVALRELLLLTDSCQDVGYGPGRGASKIFHVRCAPIC